MTRSASSSLPPPAFSPMSSPIMQADDQRSSPAAEPREVNGPSSDDVPSVTPNNDERPGSGYVTHEALQVQEDPQKCCHPMVQNSYREDNNDENGEILSLLV